MIKISSTISFGNISSTSAFGSSHCGTVELTAHRDNDSVEIKMTPNQAREMISDLRKAIKNASKPSK